MFAVIQPDSPKYGIVISRHRTPAACTRAIEKAHRALRRKAGMQHSYLNWYIVTLEAGETHESRVMLRQQREV